MKRLLTSAMAVLVALVAVFATGAFGGSSGGTITTFAGGGEHYGDGGPATKARIIVRGVAVDTHGNVYIGDSFRVRKVNTAGTITGFAGTGHPGNTGDGGPATSAQLFSTDWVAADGQGNVYIADTYHNRVRKVSPGGTITAFAGTGAFGFSGDGGPATSARLWEPTGMAVDSKGNVYIVDQRNNRVRKVSPGGTITTFAGTGTSGNSGDGGPATSARLFYPEGLAVDTKDNLYIADNGNRRVRKVSPGGTITAFARFRSIPGDRGPDFPGGLALDAKGNVYIAYAIAGTVQKVSPGGKVTTFAGRGGGGFSGDGGPAALAELRYPRELAVDAKGNVYIADTGNGRVRKVGTSTTASATYAGFYSPSRNLSCTMADRDARGTYVYCQSVKAPTNVRMSLNGRLRICHGTRCLGSPAKNTRTLGYGKKVAVGRFRCHSLQSGVRCTVIRSGKGFLINRAGVKRVGP